MEWNEYICIEHSLVNAARAIDFALYIFIHVCSIQCLLGTSYIDQRDKMDV